MNEAIREVLAEAGLPPLPEPLAAPLVDSHTISIPPSVWPPLVRSG